MKLLLKRIAKQKTYTIGKLYIDGVYECDTLEDTDRGLSDDMTIEEIKKKKVYGQTAIPSGTYEINMDVVSPKFKNRSWAKPYNGKLPRLMNVPGYEGVLIHVGNKPEDTLGCLLVGQNKIKGQVVNSTATFHELMEKLTEVHEIGEKISITIE